MSKLFQPPRTADLDDPLYYLKNVDMVVGWVLDHHRDLLTGAEDARLVHFRSLSVSARALLTRMIMRSGELFRADRLNYPELPSTEAEAITELAKDNWLDENPELTLDELFRLFTLGELRAVFSGAMQERGYAAGVSKAIMKQVLADSGFYRGGRSLRDWLGDVSPAVVRLRDMPLFERIRLMFFGNLRQSWSDFVLVELGYQRYEEVPFTPDSRAFAERGEVDAYLLMHQCRQWLDEGVSASDVWPHVPVVTCNAWLEARRNRLLLELGRQAERQGQPALALKVLAASQHREARIKQLRLLERLKRYQEAWQLLTEGAQELRSDSEAVGLERIQRRLAKKLRKPVPEPVSAPDIREFTLTLPEPPLVPVEMAVAVHLSTTEAPVHYVENTLFNGLFGLLFWEAIFQPLPGAFFHPFHSGPADLYWPDFVERRQASVDQGLKALQSDRYRNQILQTWERKQGITNPFVVWPALTDSLLEATLETIPARHLEAMFRRVLANLREHRSGFPDLIRFRSGEAGTAPRYELIEVKGPGDRLQDHQRRWLEFFAGKGIPASVCYVSWPTAEVSE